MKFHLFSLVLALSLFSTWTNCQNQTWSFEPWSNESTPFPWGNYSTPSYNESTTPTPTPFFNYSSSMISQAISIIAADLMKQLDPWLMDTFYVSFEDIMSGNISQSSIQAWVEWFIDHENNMFYEEMHNASLPTSYYQQTFDQKYEQLMSNIANVMFNEFKHMFDMFDWLDMFDGDNNHNNSSNSTSNNSTWFDSVGEMLHFNSRGRRAGGQRRKPVAQRRSAEQSRPAPPPPPPPKPQPQPEEDDEETVVEERPSSRKSGGRLARLLVSIIKNQL